MKVFTLEKKEPFYQVKISPELLGNCSLFLLLCGDLVWSVIFHAGTIVGLGEEDKAILVALQSVITFFPCLISAIIYRKIRKSGFFVILPVCLLLFLFSATIHPEYQTWIFAGNWDIWTTIFAPSCGLYMFLYIQLSGSSDRIFKTVVNASWVNLFYIFVRFLRVLLVGNIMTFKSIGLTFTTDYDMTLGYIALFTATVFLYKCLRKINMIDFLCLIVCIVTVIFGGSRGAFGLLGLAFLVFAFEFRKKLLSNKYIIMLCILGFGLLMLIGIFVKEIQTFLLLMLEKNNIHSRTLTMLLTGQIVFDNGRNAIKEGAIELIKTGGLFGHGVYGDRYVLVNIQDAGYPHNIYYEMAVQFGPILAVLLLTFIAIMILFVLFSCKDKYFRAVYLFFLISSGKLLMSDSFWYNKYFWGLLGLTMLYWRGIYVKKKRIMPFIILPKGKKFNLEESIID